ncbi:hypothetical protein WBG78_14470 [Chryseolinea sp. T2]|uniref:hypothetical protein n=1 Tax=Chryseolinea sp. T2 TaxID=3129255 RepID=UPI003078866C
MLEVSRLKPILKKTAIVLLSILFVGKMLLWFPQPAFAHKVEYKNFTVYATNPINGDVGKIFDSVIEQIKRSENYNAQYSHRIFLCEPGTFYHQLLFTENGSYASNMTFRHNIFIFPFADFERNTVTRAHSTTSYRLDQLLAHEITHTFMTDKLPSWKKEGYAEYIASYRVGYVESGDLKENAITLLTSKDYFLTNELGIPRPLPYFKARTLVEYLIFIDGFTFAQIKSDSITDDKTMAALKKWADR